MNINRLLIYWIERNDGMIFKEKARRFHSGCVELKALYSEENIHQLVIRSSWYEN